MGCTAGEQALSDEVHTNLKWCSDISATDISATDVSATDTSDTENDEGGPFDHNHKFWIWHVCMHNVMHFLIFCNQTCMRVITADSKMHENIGSCYFS